MSTRSAPSEDSSTSVVKGRTSTSNVSFTTRECWAANPGDIANAVNEVHQGIEESLVSGNTLNDPTTTVLQVEPEASPLLIAPERPRRQKRRSLKLMVPSLRPGRRRNFKSLPPILASVAAFQPKRNATSPSPQPLGRVSSPPTSPKRFWRVLRSWPKGDIQTVLINEVPEDTRRTLDDGNKGAVDMTYCDSSVGDYQSMVLSSIDEVDSLLEVTCGMPTGTAHEDSALFERTTALSLGMDGFEGQEFSNATEQTDLPPIDPAYKALLPIFYGLETITLSPYRRSLGEEHEDEDYSKFWETFGQLSAREVLYAVYAIRAGALIAPIESPNPNDDLPVLTTFCALWAALATILAVYFYTSLP
ncbi:hypothetical protein LXA43DRAFT_737722 [Ganoderma leucocontextum]|nr:hypothetical protein LXA43DRAFT_737722 [Ganoderma leucocontextum]